MTPLFGSTEVDGELIAVPLVLAGLVLLLRAEAQPAPAHRVGVAGGRRSGRAPRPRW